MESETTVLVKKLHPRLHGLVMLILQPCIAALLVPWVQRVIPQHVVALLGYLNLVVFENLVEIFLQWLVCGRVNG